MQAYGDFLRFGALPHAGGTFDQPGRLLAEMRTVHAVYTSERKKIESAKAERDRATANRRRSGRAGR